MDAVLAEPYGLGKVKKDEDYAEARQLEEKIFPLLCGALNSHHKTKHSERFWRILLGHWFRRYIDVLLNRFKTLHNCLDTYKISGITVYKNDQYSLAPLDSYSAIWAFNDNRWNDALISKILTFQGNVDFPIASINDNSALGFRFNAKKTTLKKIFLKWGYKQFGRSLSLFIKYNDEYDNLKFGRIT
jgi:putative transferase (TIGR04331 family)